MAQQLSAQTKKIHKYLDQGMPCKDIADKLRVSRQVVYNVQYQLRKRAREGSVASGIASVKPTPKKSGTGITSLPIRTAPTRNPTVPTIKPNPVQSKPTLWQRIKNFMFSNY